jgi:hypothetical protein
MALTLLKAGQIDPAALGANKSITKTDSYTITAADIDGASHLFVYVDSTGATNPLVITLPTVADMSGMLITVWVETYNKQTLVKNSAASTRVTFRGVDDWATTTSDGTKYLTMGYDVTSASL